MWLNVSLSFRSTAVEPCKSHMTPDANLLPRQLLLTAPTESVLGVCLIMTTRQQIPQLNRNNNNLIVITLRLQCDYNVNLRLIKFANLWSIDCNCFLCYPWGQEPTARLTTPKWISDHVTHCHFETWYHYQHTTYFDTTTSILHTLMLLHPILQDQTYQMHCHKLAWSLLQCKNICGHMMAFCFSLMKLVIVGFTLTLD